jgi:glycoside/pentoside/hexuronide:cation symporter, GPH family
MGDVVDQEAVETGARRAGAAFALLTLTNKLGYALSVGIAYPLLGLMGFSGERGAANSAEALSGILSVFVTLPSALLFTTALLLRRFPRGEREQAKLRARLAEGS